MRKRIRNARAWLRYEFGGGWDTAANLIGGAMYAVLATLTLVVVVLVIVGAIAGAL